MSASTTGDQAGLITIISDTICPWCYIGKRRLDAALQQLDAEGLRFDVEWRPFQLNPDMPDDGLDRQAYRTTKFGAARSDVYDRQMVKIGVESGIAFRYDLIDRTPNTLASHVMITDARRAGGLAMQGLAVERLFQAYFCDGLDIGRPEVLYDIARLVGFDHAPSVSAELWELVEQEDAEARQAGISGVPTFLLNGHFLLGGAQPGEVVADALRTAVASRG